MDDNPLDEPLLGSDDEPEDGGDETFEGLEGGNVPQGLREPGDEGPGTDTLEGI